MATLKNYPVAKQAVANSCWACAARSVVNFLSRKTVYASDQELADAYAAKSKNSKHPGSSDINTMQSASDALFHLGYPNQADGAPFPTADELEEEFKNGKPVLSIVGSTDPKGSRDLAFQSGHWVVIIGISSDKKSIEVFDPDDGTVHTMAYDAALYTPAYWQNSSYF